MGNVYLVYANFEGFYKSETEFKVRKGTQRC